MQLASSENILGGLSNPNDEIKIHSILRHIELGGPTMAELRGAALSILGVEIGGNPLVGINLDALNTLFVAMLARMSEFQAKVTRLEAELESKTSKAETSALREKMRSLPTTEDVENITRTVDAKAAKGELEVRVKRYSTR